MKVKHKSIHAHNIKSIKQSSHNIWFGKVGVLGNYCTNTTARITKLCRHKIMQNILKLFPATLFLKQLLSLCEAEFVCVCVCLSQTEGDKRNKS